MKPFNSSNFVLLTPEMLEIGNSETPAPPTPAHTAYLSTCREGFYLMAAHCPVPGRKIMVPAYTCWTCYEPFRELGWEVAYYPVDRNLRIKKDGFLKTLQEFQPNFVFAQVYYGMDLNEEELGLLAEAKKAGCFILEDLTQALFSDRRPDMVDAYSSSFYKWLPVPDGGYIYSESLPDGLDEHLAENTPRAKNRRLALQLFRHYLESSDRLMFQAAWALEAAGSAGNPYGRRSAVPHRMSDFSRRVLAAQDLEQINRQRMKNAACLYEKLKDNKLCYPVYSCLEDITSGPLFFPIFTPDRKRFNAEVCKPNLIDAPALWGVPKEPMTGDSDVDYINRHISCLPCSQDYTEEEMAYMADLINGWDYTPEE